MTVHVSRCAYAGMPLPFANQQQALAVLEHDAGVEVPEIMHLGPFEAEPLGKGLKGSRGGHGVKRLS